ncbi:MAG: hypothetical protein HYU30_00775 [Chloroflexi bacterium]|nr:hypothetical protein [Chloroflexota bacterium]
MSAAVAGFFTGAWFTNEIAGGIVSGVVASGLVLLAGWGRHWWQYRKPWETAYEPRRDEQVGRIDLRHSDARTLIPLTIWFKARVHIERVRLTFTGGSNAPKISGLYDWNTGEGLDGKPLDPNVHVKSNEVGTWYWGYHNQLLRTPGNRETRNTIRFGLIIQTDGAFDGVLQIQPTYEERRAMPQPEQIPVHITRQ